MAFLEIGLMNAVLISVGCVVLLWGIYRSFRPAKPSSTLAPIPSEKDDPQDVYNIFEPLVDFDWQTTEPIQIRPFKSKYHLTMALENCPLDELVPMDNTYLERIKIRRELMTTHQYETLAANPKIVPSINELYTWLFGTYLPQRFPTMFHLITPPTPAPPTHVQNLVTSELVPLAPPSDPVESLRAMGAHIDCDFLLLLPSDKPQHGGHYVLEAFVNCFPAGFSSPQKLNLKLADIHAPVPHYSAKLEKSMDRFFATLPLGKMVRRVNWSVTTTPDLFIQAGNHLLEEEEAKEEIVDPEKCVLRAERQTLHRLPQTKALVFAFKTFQYPLRDVRAEGNGERMAEAIEGLTKGSAPKIAHYKRSVVWGEKVKEYLRAAA